MPMQLLGEGKYKGVLLSYGECVMALQANAGKSLRRWRKAVWLGKDPRTGSHLVGGVWGVTTSRSVRRLPSSSAWVASELDKVRGTPWLMLQKSLTVKDNFGVPPILPRVAFAVEDEAASDPESEAEAQAEQQSESVLPDNAMLADLGSVGQSGSDQSGLNRMGSVMPSVHVQRPPPPSASVAGPVIPPEDMQDVVDERKRMSESLPEGPPMPKILKSGDGRQVGAVQMPVVDADEYLEDEVDASWADDSLPWGHDAGDDATEERPPDVQGDELAAVDKAAELEELRRLEQMGVYKEIKESDIGDSVVLTCKFEPTKSNLTLRSEATCNWPRHDVPSIFCPLTSVFGLKASWRKRTSTRAFVSHLGMLGIRLKIRFRASWVRATERGAISPCTSGAHALRSAAMHLVAATQALCGRSCQRLPRTALPHPSPPPRPSADPAPAQVARRTLSPM